MKLVTSLAAVCVVAAAATAGQAYAAIEDNQSAANAAARCNGALPSFEGSLRKRPLAVINEGTSTAFVTCAFEIDDEQAVNGADYYGAYFINKGTVAATVTCTGVSGIETGAGGATVVMKSKSAIVPPNGTTQAPLFFDSVSDYGGAAIYPLTAISCQLPPGVGVNDTYVGYQTNDAT